MFKAGLLDVDGVLVDSEAIYWNANQKAYEHFGFDFTRTVYIKYYMLNHSGTRGLMADYGLEFDEDDFRKVRQEIFDRLVAECLDMMPGTIQMLGRFMERYSLGLVTSSSRNDVNAKLGKFGLLEKFSLIVTGDDVEKDKPHPEPYMKGLTGLGLEGCETSEAFAIDDSPTGIRSARDAGCITIAYPNGFTADMDFGHAHAVVQSLNEVDNDFLIDLYDRTREQ